MKDVSDIRLFVIRSLLIQVLSFSSFLVGPCSSSIESVDDSPLPQRRYRIIRTRNGVNQTPQSFFKFGVGRNGSQSIRFLLASITVGPGYIRRELLRAVPHNHAHIRLGSIDTGFDAFTR